MVQQHKLTPDFVGGTQQQQAQGRPQHPTQQTQQGHPQSPLPRLSDPDAQRHWQQQASDDVGACALSAMSAFLINAPACANAACELLAAATQHLLTAHTAQGLVLPTRPRLASASVSPPSYSKLPFACTTHATKAAVASNQQRQPPPWTRLNLVYPCAAGCMVVGCRLQHTLLQRAGVAAPEQEMVVCIMDNRGVGNSSSPVNQQAYSTKSMAQDALAVMVRGRRGGEGGRCCSRRGSTNSGVLPISCGTQRVTFLQLHMAGTTLAGPPSASRVRLASCFSGRRTTCSGRGHTS